MPDQLPEGWGENALSSFFDKTRRNLLTTANNGPVGWSRLVAIDQLLDRTTSTLVNVTGPLEAVFLVRSHSAFRAAVQLAAAAQLPEAYMVLRGCLEYALYASFMAGNVARQEIWLARQEDQAHERLVRREFRPGKMLEDLSARDPEVGRMVRFLYESVIALGAHPNEPGVSSTIAVRREEQSLIFDAQFLSPGGDPHLLCLKISAQVGIGALRIFGQVFSHRFEILGIPEEVARLGRGL